MRIEHSDGGRFIIALPGPGRYRLDARLRPPRAPGQPPAGLDLHCLESGDEKEWTRFERFTLADSGHGETRDFNVEAPFGRVVSEATGTCELDLSIVPLPTVAPEDPA